MVSVPSLWQGIYRFCFAIRLTIIAFYLASCFSIYIYYCYAWFNLIHDILNECASSVVSYLFFAKNSSDITGPNICIYIFFLRERITFSLGISLHLGIRNSKP